MVHRQLVYIASNIYILYVICLLCIRSSQLSQELFLVYGKSLNVNTDTHDEYFVPIEMFISF